MKFQHNGTGLIFLECHLFTLFCGLGHVVMQITHNLQFKVHYDSSLTCIRMNQPHDILLEVDAAITTCPTLAGVRRYWAKGGKPR